MPPSQTEDQKVTEQENPNAWYEYALQQRRKRELFLFIGVRVAIVASFLLMMIALCKFILS